MKVLLVNGSPHKSGCTYTALKAVADELEKEGINTEIFWVGNKPIAGCIGCGTCARTGKCVFDDCVAECRQKAAEADGFVFGSPVHYAAASGVATSFLDRLFYSESNINGGKAFRLKPAAAVVSARRGGNTATFDQLNKYFTISQMPIVSSDYWNMVHGRTPADVEKDEEGLQTMRILADNMAYFLKCKAAADKAGVVPPEPQKKILTDFIR